MNDVSFRQLFEAVRSAPDRTEREVLWAWRERASGLLDPLRAYGSWEARTRTKFRADDSLDREVLNAVTDLYALSRLSEILILPYQQGDYDGSSWPGVAIGQHERLAFFAALGLHRPTPNAFHPFYHEIVSVEQAADPSTPITLIAEIWPGLMLDQLMFCRAGAHVRGGMDHIVKDVAERSTLYWAYRRKNRPYEDLSHGWGSNSQWSTSFRRDYSDGTAFAYNVDGTLDVRLPSPGPLPNPSRDDLAPTERIELLINRCFVRTRAPHKDLWPWDDTYATSA